MPWTGVGCEVKDGEKTSSFRGYHPSALGWRSLHQASGLEPGAGVPWVGGGMSTFKVSMSLGLLGEHGLPPLFQFWPGSTSPEPPSAEACPPGRGQRPPRLPPEASSSPRPSCSQESRGRWRATSVSSMRIPLCLGKSTAILSLCGSKHTF